LWNGLGPRFGIGKEAQEPDRWATDVLAGLLVVTVVVEFAFSPKQGRPFSATSV
jgi:hypothetical protein